MSDIDTILKKHYVIPSMSEVSKMVLDPREIVPETDATAMAVGDIPEVGIIPIRQVEIPKLLLQHPAVERGIEFKFNRMIAQLDRYDISNNIVPYDNSDLSKDAWEYCIDILNNTSNQPVSWIKQFGRDAMRFGDNYSLLMLNKARNKVLRWELQNPIFFSPGFEDVSSSSSMAYTGIFSYASRGKQHMKYVIDKRTKKPSYYTQLKKTGNEGMTTVVNDPANIIFQPFGKKFPANRVMQLNFDRMGDVPLGIPLIQALQTVVKQIIRVEDAGTETMIAFGYNRWIANTPFRTKEKMQEFGKSIENIAKKSTIILPEGVKLDNIQPGSTEFEKVHNILLTVIAMRLGISVIQLKGESADINKSTYGEMQKDIRFDFFADELELESSINGGFVKSCIIKYKLNTPQKLKNFPFPRFMFNEMQEDEDVKADRQLKQSLSLRNISYSVDMLKANGFSKQAQAIIDNWLAQALPKTQTQKFFKKNPFLDSKLPKQEK